MSVGETSGPIHPIPTRRSAYRYQFYDKHHGRGGGDAARWAPDLSREDEFAVFDMADWHEIADERGYLYGIRLYDASGEIPDLGTRGEQVAEFPYARAGEVWHGYPVWAINEEGPTNRRGELARPSKDVFRKMEEAGLLNARDRKRLFKGKHL